MSKEGKAGDRVRESCVINGSITEIWALIRPFTFLNMPSVFQSVQAVEGTIGEPNSVCLITHASGEKEYVRITEMKEETHTVCYDVLGAERKVTCKRSIRLFPVSDKRQVFMEFISQYFGVLPLKDFIDEQLKKRAFFKGLRIALSILDETAPWDCPYCNASNQPTQGPTCYVCRKRNLLRGIKWTSVKFDWMKIRHEHKVETEEFELAGHRWRMLLFPRGLDSKSGIGAFLNVLDLTDSEAMPCDFFIRLVYPPELNGVKGVDREQTKMCNDHFTFTKREFDRGFGQMMMSDEVEARYLANGQLTFQIGVAPKKRPAVQG